MFELLLLILGLLGLLLGTELIVTAALNIAEHYKISHLFVGQTILTVGTGLPELVIAITGAFDKLERIETSGLIVGNSLGSCFGQIAFTMGILGLFGTLTLTKRKLKENSLMMLGSVALLFLAAFDGVITRIEGIVFLIIYALYFFILFKKEMVHEKIRKAPKAYVWWAIPSLVAGFPILIYCSNIVVYNAIQLAVSWGIAQSLIGILIIGAGTSLPEFAVSLGALRKKSVNLSVGNLIGSNIFNVLVPLGVASTIAGLNVSKNLLINDIPFLFVVSAIVLLFFRKDMRLERKEAFVLIVLYGSYAALKIYGW